LERIIPNPRVGPSNPEPLNRGKNALLEEVPEYNPFGNQPDLIVDEIRKYREDVYKIPHGYNGSISADPDSPLMGEIEMGFRYGINVTYIGNMNIPYLNHELLLGLVERYRNIRFHFVGSYTSSNILYQKTVNMI